MIVQVGDVVRDPVSNNWVTIHAVIDGHSVCIVPIDGPLTYEKRKVTEVTEGIPYWMSMALWGGLGLIQFYGKEKS